MAQPWAQQAGHHGHHGRGYHDPHHSHHAPPPAKASPPTAKTGEVTGASTVPYVSSTGGLSRGAGGAPLAEPPAGTHPPESYTGSYKGSPVSTVTHTGGPATSPGGTSLVLSGAGGAQHGSQSEHAAATAAMGGLSLDDPVTKPAPLAIGKTPKRPTTSNVRVSEDKH